MTERRKRNSIRQLGGVIVFAMLLSHATGFAEQKELPNIVIIYADDLGYGDVSCYNPRRGKIPTPNIDRMAKAGMRFTDAHSSSAVCSPSRYTLLTGRYHWRTRLQKGIVGLWGPPLIASDRLTIGTMLQKSGYQTACIGKWHLGWDWPITASERPLFRGDKSKDVEPTFDQLQVWKDAFNQPIEGGPINRGFDRYFGTDVPNWPPYCFIEQNRTIGIPSVFLPVRLFKNNQASVQGPALVDWSLEPILPALGERACQFVADASTRDKPFFLYMPLTSPHTPLAVNEEWRGKSQLNTYADLVMETDDVVGRVLDTIDLHEKAENTLVIFTSDNGCAPYIGAKDLESNGHYPSGPLRGYKSDVWEGGHRVPFIVRWPQQIESGARCDQLVHQADLLATCAAIVGYSLSAQDAEDSFSLLPIFADPNRRVRQHAISQSMRGLLSIRRGNWKLILGPGSGGWTKGKDEFAGQLYDLKEDLGETNNLFEARSQIVAELMSLMEELVTNGRSTAGEKQHNDVEVAWERFIARE